MAHMLFPHTQITAPDLNKIIKRFGDLTICQPWYMDRPFQDTTEADIADVHIQRPSIDLKPEGDFTKLISEYRSWVSQNRDKGYGNFLFTTQEGALTENTPWEIRQLISKGEDHSDRREGRAFKWHLILHLAREFEESSVAAEKLLNRLKDQKSPLEGALEEAPQHGFFEDTPLMETQLQVGEHRLKQVFEAWFGLFGEYIPDDATFITLNPLVISYASEILEPEENTIRPENRKKEDPLSGITNLPSLSDSKKKLKDPVLADLSGKTIVLMKK